MKAFSSTLWILLLAACLPVSMLAASYPDISGSYDATVNYVIEFSEHGILVDTESYSNSSPAQINASGEGFVLTISDPPFAMTTYDPSSSAPLTDTVILSGNKVTSMSGPVLSTATTDGGGDVITSDKITSAAGEVGLNEIKISGTGTAGGTFDNGLVKISYAVTFSIVLAGNVMPLPDLSLVVTAPGAPSVTVSDANYVFAGLAHSGFPISQVLYSLNGSAWNAAGTANLWENWSADITLTPGKNVLMAYAVDIYGNVSTTSSNVVNYVQTSPLVINTNGLGSFSPFSAGAALQVGQNYTITATPAAGFRFSGWANGAGWLTDSATLTFTMQSGLVLTATFADIRPPTLSITSPTAGQRASNAVFAVKGTASDNWQVASVFYSLNSNVWTSATGTTNWSASVNLLPGANSLRAYAVDNSGNHSTTNNVSFDLVVTNRLGLRITGLGTVSPNDSNAVLEVGRVYTLTAKPGLGFAFTNWVVSTNWLGGSVANKATLMFMMASNLTLTANFVETAKPTVRITNPPAGLRLSNTVISVMGTASDDWQVVGVWCQINSNAWLAATTTNNFKNWFTTNLNLSTGTNVVRAYAKDQGGNYSSTNSVALVVTNNTGAEVVTAEMNIGPAQPTILMTGTRLTAGGLTFNLQISGVASGLIQASRNLSLWETVTNFAGTNTTIYFSDPAAMNSDYRFYREVVP